MSFSGRVTTDDTFLRRYDISRDDRLRSFAEVERIGLDSYLSIAGLAVQSLRTNDDQGQQPFALPAIDSRWQPSRPVAAGRLEVTPNSLSLVRTDGQVPRRALARVTWDHRKYKHMGPARVTETGG